MPIVELPDQCAGCGACCWPRVELEEADTQVPEDLTFIDPDDGKRYMKRGRDLYCVALDRETKLCTIYDQRPKVCQDFERGTKPCFDALFAVHHGEMVPDLDRFKEFFDEMDVAYREQAPPTGGTARAIRLSVGRTEFCFEKGGLFTGIFHDTESRFEQREFDDEETGTTAPRPDGIPATAAGHTHG